MSRESAIHPDHAIRLCEAKGLTFERLDHRWVFRTPEGVVSIPYQSKGLAAQNACRTFGWTVDDVRKLRELEDTA